MPARAWWRSAASSRPPAIAPTSLRSARVAREVGAIVFVDGSQMVGAVAVAEALRHVDVLATADHKFLLNAGRGMGYCFLSRAAQERFTPINAGWRAGADPFASFFGPTMELSPTASRFDSSISWLAAFGNRTVARHLRPVRTRHHLQPEPRPRGAAAGRPHRCRLGAGRPARGEPEHHPQGSARRPRTRPGRPRPVRAASHRLGTRRRPALLGPPLQPRGRHRPARRDPRVAGAATRTARNRRHGPPELPRIERHRRAMIGQSTMKPLGPHGPPGNPMTAPDSARSSTWANSVSRVGRWPAAHWVRCTSHSGL